MSQIGLDGALLGVERYPLSVRALEQIQKIVRVKGWRVTLVGEWRSYWRCGACDHAQLASIKWIGGTGPQDPYRAILTEKDQCDLCTSTAGSSGIGRAIRFFLWYAPWTWGRPFVVDFRDDPRAEDESLPAPVPTSGELTLVPDVVEERK